MPNSDLLRKIADAIEANPDQYDQKTWLAVPNRFGRLQNSMVPATVLRVREGKFRCGATACVAGHAVVMSDIDPEQYLNALQEVDIFTAARDALDIDSGLATWLFDHRRRESAMPAVLRAIADGETDTTRLREVESKC